MATKPKARALMTFTVRHRKLRVKVRLLPILRDVHREYTEGGKQRAPKGKEVHAFFRKAKSRKAKHIGTIVLPSNGRLKELIPHEVTHAVLHKMRVVKARNDEACATSVGILSARIDKEIRRKFCI